MGWMATALAVVLMAGCGEELKITATPIKNVDNIQYNEAQLDVYCPTGICQFDLAVNKDTALTVNMHYDSTRSFEKIEGVSVTGKAGSSAKMLDGNSFELGLEANDKPITVQVVDYYRN